MAAGEAEVVGGQVVEEGAVEAAAAVRSKEGSDHV